MPSRGGLVTVSVDRAGETKLRNLATALKDAGAKDLQKELAAGLRRAVKPMRKEFQRGALGILPYRGGLAEQVVADTRYRTKVSVGKNPSVRISASLPGHDLPAMDRGRLRHPVFGNRRNWVNQSVRPGWFTDSGTLAGQDARVEILKAIDQVAAKLEARI